MCAQLDIRSSPYTSCFFCYASSGANGCNVLSVIQVQGLLQQMQDKFQTTSDTIITRIDDMGGRIDDLEKNIADIMTQAGIDEK